MRYIFKVASVAAVLCAGLVGLTTQSASAAPCYGASCNGRSATTCSADARTVDSSTLRLAPPTSGFAGKYVYSQNYRGTASRVGFELRYSPSCRANWARISSMDKELYGELSVWNPGAPSRKTWISDGGAGTRFTPMVDGTKKACFGMQIYSGGRWRTWQTGYCA